MIFGEEDSDSMTHPPDPSAQPQQIQLDASAMETIYANFFALAGSSDELVVYLGANSPLPNVTRPIIRLSHRLMLLPANAKRLMLALQQAVRAHEERFGPIELPPPPHQRPDAPR
jgi:hypothetical protein